MTRPQRLVFGEDAELYERARPSYPAELIAEVIALVPAAPRAIDVGCGTGKAAIALATAGAVGVGVEADPAMAAIARRNLAGVSGWRIDVSGFEEWQPRPGEESFDLATCAQAWHWIDPAVRGAKARSLLRPGGWLALWWHRAGPDGSPLRRAMDDAYAPIEQALPARGLGERDRPSQGFVPSGPGFGPPIERSYDWRCSYSASEWLDLLATQSNHRLLDPGARAALFDRLGTCINDAGGVYEHHYTTWLWAVPRC